MSFIRLIYLTFVLALSVSAQAQNNVEVTYHSDGFQQGLKKFQSKFKDSLDLVTYLGDYQKKAIKKGYLLFSIDSVQFTERKANVYYYSGQKFSESILIIDPVELKFIRKHSPVNEKLVANTEFNPAEVARLLNTIHECYLNNGYPFAKVNLTEIDLSNDVLHANIDISKGPRLNWREIIVKGDSSLSVKYISNIIGISEGDLYSEQPLKLISNKIEQIPFLQEIRSYELLFTNEGVDLYLYIQSNPVSSINGVVGFQPNPATERLTITGDINLRLLNVLKRGELLDLRWQSIQAQTQSLTSRLNYPFLFSTPFGLDLSFDLYKRDTSFLDINTNIGVQYFLNRGNYIKGFYENKSSNVLSGGANNPTFTNLGNVRNHMYGLAYSSSKVDYLPNPSRGRNIYVESSVGNRSYRASDTVEFQKTTTVRGKIKLEYFVPLAKRHVLRLANMTDFYSAEDIFENELYRFGGLNSQRGFNEDELFASTKSTTTVEYRFLLDRNSHVFLFGDGSWYENNAAVYMNDAPIGFGLGFAFSTNLGVFSISYALGKQLDNPVLFSDSKIHFGYIAYF
jgi:outer membrane protein assembly factor BamA